MKKLIQKMKTIGLISCTIVAMLTIACSCEKKEIINITIGGDTTLITYDSIVNGIDSNEVNAYILYWQSNAEGWTTAPVSNLPPYLKQPISKALIYNRQSGAIETLLAGVNNQAYNNLYHGIEMSFMHDIVQKTGKKCLLIKYAVGGTPMYNDGSNFNWNANKPGNLYDTLKMIISLAKSQAVTQGYKIKFKAVIGYGGEADAQVLAYANALQGNLINWIGYFRTYMNEPTLKYVQIRPHAVYTYNATTRAAIQNIKDNNLTSNYDWLDTDPYEPTVIHPMSSSYVYIGQDLAEKVKLY